MSTEFKDGNFKSNELSKCPFTGGRYISKIFSWKRSNKQRLLAK